MNEVGCHLDLALEASPLGRGRERSGAEALQRDQRAGFVVASEQEHRLAPAIEFTQDPIVPDALRDPAAEIAAELLHPAILRQIEPETLEQPLAPAMAGVVSTIRHVRHRSRRRAARTPKDGSLLSGAEPAR